MKKLKIILFSLLILSSCSKDSLDDEKINLKEDVSKEVINSRTAFSNQYNSQNYLALLSQLTVKAIINDIDARNNFSMAITSEGLTTNTLIYVNSLINLNDGLNDLEAAIINEYDSYVATYAVMQGIRPKSIPPPPPEDDDDDESIHGSLYMSAIEFLTTINNKCLEYHIPNLQQIAASGSLGSYIQSNGSLIATNHPLSNNLFNDALLFTGNPYVDADIEVDASYQVFNALVISVRPEVNNNCIPNSNIDYTLFLN